MKHFGSSGLAVKNIESRVSNGGCTVFGVSAEDMVSQGSAVKDVESLTSSEVLEDSWVSSKIGRVF